MSQAIQLVFYFATVFTFAKDLLIKQLLNTNLM